MLKNTITELENTIAAKERQKIKLKGIIESKDK